VHSNAVLNLDQGYPVPFQVVSSHPVDVYLYRLAPGSRQGQKQALDGIARMLSNGCCDSRSLDWPSLTYAQTSAIRATWIERYSPNTCKRMVAALRGVLKDCWRLGLMRNEEYARAADTAPIKGELPARGRALKAEELRKLFKACQEDISPAGVRDGAILALLYMLGLRRSEPVALDLVDYKAEEGKILIRGKGQKPRFGFVVDGTRELLEPWLKLWGILPGPLFLPLTKRGHLVLKRLTTESVAQVLTKRAVQAGVSEFSCHDLRRSFITHLLDAGADFAVVQKMAGHKQVSTTLLYDKRGEEAQVKAEMLLGVP